MGLLENARQMLQEAEGAGGRGLKIRNLADAIASVCSFISREKCHQRAISRSAEMNVSRFWLEESKLKIDFQKWLEVEKARQEFIYKGSDIRLPEGEIDRIIGEVQSVVDYLESGKK